MATTTIPPHDAARIVRGGPPREKARGVLIMIHGRGASPESIVPLADAMDAADWALVAPGAVGNTWYPYSFLAPTAQNEPGITSGIALIESLVQDALDAGWRSDQVALLGFSQGACLTLEFVARHPRRYTAVIGFSGGVIGPPGTPREYQGSLDGTPVFLGCSDVDSHVPAERVRESKEVLERMGATVDMRLYPGMGHLVNEDEISAGRALLRA